MLALLHLIDQPGDNQDVALTFTLRPRSLRHHGGQISFPGGRAEREDGSYVHTALRETQEELGIATQGIRILGEMTPLFIAPSQNLVHPFVGWIRALPPLHPSPAEVDRVLQIPLTSLLKPEAVDTYQWQHNGALRSAPCFRVGDVIIWGATAMMLNELLEVIRRIRG